MAYQFEEPFVLDTTKYQSVFGNSATPLSTAIAATVAWYRDPTSPPHAQEGSASWLTQPPVTPAQSTAASPASVPPAGYRTLVNPATGERIQFIDPIEGDGDVVRFNWSSIPGGAIPEHSHPHQEETFIISAGQAQFTAERRATRGRGRRKNHGAPGSPSRRDERRRDPVEGTVELRPALHTRQMHEAFAGLAAEGKTTERGAPKNPLQLGATLWYFRHESRVTSPPVWVQNLILPPLSMLARLFGVRAYHDRWDSECPHEATHPQGPDT